LRPQRQPFHQGFATLLRADLKDSYSGLRASELKRLLEAKGVSTRGLFERHELLSKLMSVEPSSAPAPNTHSFCEFPLVDIPLGPSKSCLGIDITLNSGGGKVRFMIDTAASLSLIKSSKSKELGLASESATTSTAGLGGTGSIASRVCKLGNVVLSPSPTSSSSVRVENLELAVLDRDNALPPQCDGLLGLDFLTKLPKSLSEFDFGRRVLRVAMDKLPSQAAGFACISLQKVPTGLRVCEAVLPLVTSDGSGSTSVSVAGLIDIGSSYSIFNAAAVSALSSGKVALFELPPSKTLVAGIDGRPVELRLLRLQGGLVLGGRFKLPGPIDVFAGELQGFAAIGMGGLPAGIVGLDVLAGARGGVMGLDLAANWMYIKH